MKSTFLGFYSLDENELRQTWLSDSTLFVFDTNCLLNLYRCEDQTRDDILNVMREIAHKIWIPFQVGFEYQRNRRKVIEESIKSLATIKSELEKIHTQNILSSSGIKKHLYNSLSEEIVTLQEEIRKPIKDYIDNKVSPRIESKRNISDHDSIRDYIDEIVQDRVGKLPSQELINAINEEGVKRYVNQQPPGFMDDKKTEVSYYSNIELKDKYGDLYIWKEIIEKAKDDDVQNVIFICDDSKKDWWFSYSGKTHGVLESLKTEICREANIRNFKAISQLTFLHEAKAYLNNIEIQESSLKEVEELSHLGQSEVEEKIASDYSPNDYMNISNYNKHQKYKSTNILSKLIHFKDDYSHDSNEQANYLTSEVGEKASAARSLIMQGNFVLSQMMSKRESLINIIPEKSFEDMKGDLIDKLIEMFETKQQLEEFILKDDVTDIEKAIYTRSEVSRLGKIMNELQLLLDYIKNILSSLQ